MNESEYIKLSKDLQNLAKITPLKWGNIQNDFTDRKISMFTINTFQELEFEIKSLSEDEKNYFRRRWFLWKCAQCDEFLFYKHSNVNKNPNPRDQEYDVEFFNNKKLRFDIKGTLIPRDLRNNPLIIDNKLIDKMIHFFYTHQSKGVRNNNQNRLFITHHSEISQNREMFLRTYWDFKEKVYCEYINYLKKSPKIIKYENVECDIVFIIERLDNKFDFYFGSTI